MARFDVFKNQTGFGYLLDVQSDLLDDLNSRVVVPLLPIDQAPLPAERLNPVFEIDATEHVLVTQFMAAVPANELSESVANLQAQQDAVTNALDMLFFGF